MQFQSIIKAFMIPAIIAISSPVKAQTGIGLNRYANSSFGISTIGSKDKAAPAYFAFNKPVATSIVRSDYEIVAPTPSLLYVEGNRPMPSYFPPGGHNKKAVGIGLLIGGGICLIGSGILFVAASNSQGDDLGLATAVCNIGGGILLGCGLGLSIPGLVLVLRNSDGGRSRRY